MGLLTNLTMRSRRKQNVRCRYSRLTTHGGRAVAKPVSWARGAYGLFGRVLAVRGAVFVAGPIAWVVVVDGCR